MSAHHRRLLLGVFAATLAACATASRSSGTAGYGPRPELPAAEKGPIPVINVVKAKGWPQGVKPASAPGVAVTAFATGLDHPRWLYVLPNGDVLVAETNAPERPADGKGLKASITRQVMKQTGGSVPSANRITLLRDADGDGVAELRTPFLQGLSSFYRGSARHSAWHCSAITSTSRTPTGW